MQVCRCQTRTNCCDGSGKLEYPKIPCELGPLTAGTQCRTTNLRNGHVPCCYFCNFHVGLEIVLYCMSNVKNGQCHVIDIFSHVDIDF